MDNNNLSLMVDNSKLQESLSRIEELLTIIADKLTIEDRCDIAYSKDGKCKFYLPKDREKRVGLKCGKQQDYA